jgi:hypothetical protein
MTESCCCSPEAGNVVCDLPAQKLQRPVREVVACRECGKTGKPVDGQTVKSLLCVSLREIKEVQYLFCRTENCPVVYFSSDTEQVFTVRDVREHVYQKGPEAAEVFVCYCFRHTVGELRATSHEGRIAIVDNINTGISAGQCACNLRNPQGSCCLGNVNRLIKQLERQSAVTT